MAVHGTKLSHAPPAKRAKLDKDKRAFRPSQRFVKIAGLLSEEEDLQRQPLQPVTRDGLSTTLALKGIRKSTAKVTSALRQSKRRDKRREAHPLYVEFADIVEAYEEGAAVSQLSKIEPIFQQLLARADGKDVDGSALTRSALISDQDVKALEVEQETLSKSFDSELLRHKKMHSDGTTTLTEVQLGKTMQTFEQKIRVKRTELEKLLKELADVQREIDIARQDIEKREAVEVKQARAELAEKLQELSKNAVAARDSTLAAVAKGRKEDQASKAETTRKFEEMFDFMG